MKTKFVSLFFEWKNFFHKNSKNIYSNEKRKNFPEVSCPEVFSGLISQRGSWSLSGLFQEISYQFRNY